ncbi:MAG: ribosomal-protein-alanine N-acetyltransferase [Thermoprotei archaeon]|nr:MAG: ribosomal-protein-alanine N-acetyltransferase [Thermoprotei archaeon]
MASHSPTGAVKGLNIREARADELSLVHEIEVACFKQPYGLSLLKMYHTLSPDLFLVAEAEGRIVGYVIGLCKKWGEGHVISLAVHPDYRRKGIGRALMEALLTRFKERGMQAARLEVRVSNTPAIRLYEKLGFRIKGVLRGYYLDGEDAYLMVKEL